jgi:hypothetical protein
MHCFLFLVLSLPAHDIDEYLPSTSPRYHPSLVPTPVIHLVDLLISLAPHVARRRTFFFSSTEIPPGPTLTSSKRPPTIAINQFKPYRSCEDTYREFGNYNVSLNLIRRGNSSLQVVFKEISLRMSRVNAPPVY